MPTVNSNTVILTLTSIWTCTWADDDHNSTYVSKASTIDTQGASFSAAVPSGATITGRTLKTTWSNTGTVQTAQVDGAALGASVDSRAVSSMAHSYTWRASAAAMSSQGNYSRYMYVSAYIEVTYTESSTPPPTGGFAISLAHIDAGQTLTASIVPANASYRHRIIYAHDGGANFYIADLDPGDYTDAYFIPMDWLKSIPNATRGLCTATLYTISGDGLTAIGNTSLNFYIYAPATVVPTLTGITATLVSNGVDASITRYVQNYSKCALEITGAAGTYDSTIVSYKITGGGFTVNAVSGTAGTFGTTGDLTFTATVTDSRGRTASATVTITVDAYNMPSLTDISAFRCDEFGTADRRGGYVLLKATPVIASIGGQNSAALAGRVYAKGGTPGTPETMVSNTASILGGGLLLPVKSYIAEIIVQDLINSANYTKTIPTDRVALHFLDSISAGAINKYAEIPNALEIAWPMLMLDGGPAAKYEIGDILITLNSTSPATRFPGTTWAAIAEGTFPVAAGTGYTAGSTGGEATHVLTKAELPAHNHTIWNLNWEVATGPGGGAVATAYAAKTALSGAAGSGAAHNNMPPYLAVYMWERTA